MIKGILFDKDGTLIDFNEVWGTAVGPVMDRLLADCHMGERELLKRELLERLGIHGNRIDPEGAFAWMTYQEITNIIWAFLREEHIETLPEKEIFLKKVQREFYREVVEDRTEYPMFTDVKVLFQTLTEEGFHVGLATTDTYDSTRAFMDRLGASDYITFWGTDDGILPVKPDEKLAVLAADEWKIYPEELLMVGDTPNDMRFAHNGHIYALGVLSGTGQRKDMEQLADDLIESVAELPAWIRKKRNEENKDGND